MSLKLVCGMLMNEESLVKGDFQFIKVEGVFFKDAIKELCPCL